MQDSGCLFYIRNAHMICTACSSQLLTQQECQHETLHSISVCYAAHCSVGSMRQRGEWSHLAVGQCVTTSTTLCQPTTQCLFQYTAATLSPTLSSCHGSSLTRGTCRRRPCIMPTASSLFHETPDWDLSESTCPPLRCIIQPCYRHHPDNQTS